uniref:BPTI/Kunitz inhibitor domain-containing protein n=1 Tax=Timema tahoe TaxID=61484 RepID=A0A7R9IRV9_9NEOP|nr:unnamed protein product [Timema tahoe]
MKSCSCVFFFALIVYSMFIHISEAKPSSKEDTNCCSLEPRSGVCLAYMPKYYFDSQTNSCRRFIYGGCFGNCNRFDTAGECMTACIKNDT